MVKNLSGIQHIFPVILMMPGFHLSFSRIFITPRHILQPTILMGYLSKESHLGLEKGWFLMSLCIFSIAHPACAGTHILVRQHSAKGQGNYTFASSKWLCSSGRIFKKLSEVVFCQFSALNKPRRWWGNFQSWQKRKSGITSGQWPLQQFHLWGEEEFSRGTIRDCNSATEECRLKRSGPINGDFFRKQVNDNFLMQQLNFCFMSTLFCVLLNWLF